MSQELETTTRKRAPGGGRKAKGGKPITVRLSHDTEPKVDELLAKRLLENPKFTKTDAIEEMIRAYKIP